MSEDMEAEYRKMDFENKMRNGQHIVDKFKEEVEAAGGYIKITDDDGTPNIHISSGLPRSLTDKIESYVRKYKQRDLFPGE